jgi:hypothetical protein
MSEQDEAKRKAEAKVTDALAEAPKRDGEGTEESKNKRAEGEAQSRELHEAESSTGSRG